eukprot:6555855-Pyramimonas_sp.AAC.1
MFASWSLLEGLVGLSWGVFGVSSAVFRASWASWIGRSAIRAILDRLGGPLGALFARLGTLLGLEKVMREAGTGPVGHARSPRRLDNL